jgi:hypothetical protein
MKRLIVLLLLATSVAHAQLLLSDFSSFTPDAYSQPFPADSTSWSALTAQSGAATFTVGDFGAGAPGGAIGNGFIEFLSAPADWTDYASVVLRGFAAAANATPSLWFYVEDENLSSALTPFSLASFGTGPSAMERAMPLSLAGLDAARITAWGFVVQEADNPAFGFTFDNVALMSPVVAVPEPATYGFVAGIAVAVLALFRRSRRA